MELEQAIEKLGGEFAQLNWAFVPERIRQNAEIMSYWPGAAHEDVLVCVLKARHIDEQFHRQDFFFFNFAYRQPYQALSIASDNLVTIEENDGYIGQPFSGYAIKGNAEQDIIIVGVLIQKDAFFREYLPALCADNAMFHFFLDPQGDRFSDAFLHLRFGADHPLRRLLELMIVEYAERREDTQAVLKPMTLALLMQVARQYRLTAHKTQELALPDQLLRYISEHIETVTLGALAARFAYHPNYLSALLRQKTGRTFSEIVLAQRMERALALLKGTNLSIEEVAAMVGYPNASNFYRAFRGYYHASPRAYPPAGRKISAGR